MKEYSISKEQLDNIVQTIPEVRRIINKIFHDYKIEEIYKTGSRFRRGSSSECMLAQIGPNLLVLIDLEEGNRIADHKIECKHAGTFMSWYIPDDHPLWGYGRSCWTLVKE